MNEHAGNLGILRSLESNEFVLVVGVVVLAWLLASIVRWVLRRLAERAPLDLRQPQRIVRDGLLPAPRPRRRGGAPVPRSSRGDQQLPHAQNASQRCRAGETLGHALQAEGLREGEPRAVRFRD